MCLSTSGGIFSQVDFTAISLFSTFCCMVLNSAKVVKFKINGVFVITHNYVVSLHFPNIREYTFLLSFAEIAEIDTCENMHEVAKKRETLQTDDATNDSEETATASL